MRTRLLTFAAVALTIAGACGRLQLGNNDKREEMNVALQQTLQRPSRPAFVTGDEEGTRLWKSTQEFYAKRNHEAAWMRDAAPRSQMEAFIKALREAGNEGLDPELYGVSMLETKYKEASEGFLSKKGFDPKEAAALDVWLSYLYMKYASDLADGLSDLSRADTSWRIKADKFNPLPHLEKALLENRVTDSLAELVPDDPKYQSMRKALVEYRAQAAKGGWPKVPPTLKVKPGQQNPQLRVLAERLAATGDYTGTIPADGQAVVYDAPLQEAVKRFQRRHGLQDDAIIASAVLAEMNVPIEERISQLSFNMERWRWLPRELGARHILVNVPEQRLEVWENGQVPLTMRVIVGKQDTQTPIFNDEMTHIVFSPYWNVPPNIARGETLPSLMNDPSFLARNNMEVVDRSGNVVDASAVGSGDLSSFRFRQRPGSSNALGLVKFMFPNQYDVYLHDTPTDSLFGRGARLFSHGCVRVEKPEELATYLLRDQPEWTPERIRAAMHAGSERHVKLGRPVPVYLGYWTARVSADGLVQFRKDVYGIDGRANALLADRLRRLKASSSAAETAAAVPDEPGKDKKSGKATTR